jgi:CubicO group peptidase (beta-lactamase class C family)
LQKALVSTAQKYVIAPGVSPGIAIGVGCGETPIVSVGVGRTEPDGKGVTVSPATTKYDLASTTKPFTAAILLKLQEEGKLKLKDKVSKYLGGYTGGGREKITLFELLTHTSGLNSREEDYRGIVDKASSPQDARNRILAQTPTGEPGKQFAYSNSGFTVAWAAGEAALNGSLEAKLSADILLPLGMKNTTFRPKTNCAPTRSDYSDERFMCTQQDLLARKQGGVSGHAGLFSTTEDLGKFAAMLVQNGTFAGKTILKADSVKAMAKPQGDKNYGTGVRINADGKYCTKMSEAAFGHTGWNGTFLMVDPKTGMWITIGMNASLTNRIAKVDGQISTARTALCGIVGSSYTALQ